MSNETIVASKAAEVDAVINNHVALSMGAGLIPLPFVDVAAVASVHYKMLKEISTLYGVEFDGVRVKSIVASLLAGFGSTSLATASVRTVTKFVPGIGSILGAITLPFIAGAFTYAVGKVVAQHFESGGTFLTFDSLDVKSGLATEFQKGKACLSEKAKSVGQRASEFSDKIENKLDSLIEAGC